MADLEGKERAQYVQQMFARVAGRYDLMNRLMTGGQDIRWRRYLIARAQLPPNGRLLDIATGTGDIAHEAQQQIPGLAAVGGDFTVEMMRAGQGLPGREKIRWVGADTLALPFPDRSFDAVTSGFLMRNVIDVPQALREQLRVTRPGGYVVILESSPPKRNLLRPFILFHLNVIIPLLGKLITGETDAYRYLPDSTQRFQQPEELATGMRQAGLTEVSYRLFMFGTVGIHVGRRPADSAVTGQKEM